MLVRSAARDKEIAVRVALGAGRPRLLRQLLTESITLSVLGGTAGALLASWGISLLLAVNPIPLPRYNRIGVDVTVLVFTLVASVLTGIVFGLAPAWQMFRFDIHSTLKEGGRSGSVDSGQRKLSRLLVVTEVAMAFVLLIGAGLLIRSFARLLEVKPGYDTDNILTMQVGLPNASYGEPEKRIAFLQQLETRLKGVSDVTSVGVVTRLPLMSALNNVTTFLSIEGRQVPTGERPEIDFRRASTGYFQTMGIPLSDPVRSEGFDIARSREGSRNRQRSANLKRQYHGAVSGAVSSAAPLWHVFTRDLRNSRSRIGSDWKLRCCQLLSCPKDAGDWGTNGPRCSDSGRA